MRRFVEFSQQTLRRVEQEAKAKAEAKIFSQSSSATGSACGSVVPVASAKRVRQSLELCGKSYLLPTLAVTRHEIEHGYNLDKTTSYTYKKMPIVLDLQQVSSDGSPHRKPISQRELRIQLERLQLCVWLALEKTIGFLPLGITNASEDVKKHAVELRLPYLISTRMDAVECSPGQASNQSSTEEELSEFTASDISDPITESPFVPNASVPKALEPAMVVEGSVRSGQQVYAQNRSLVVLGSVNSGAEVLSDGDIHVFGTLKGRALAGIGGNSSARIFAQQFDAELISIADRFTTCDEALESPDEDADTSQLIMHHATWIQLTGNKLRFQSVK